MKNYSWIIRFTLWWGIIADLLETIRMAVPVFFIKTAGLQANVDKDFRFALLYGAPVMLGWTLILFWADKKPIERKGVFLCLIPVILTYSIVEMIGIKMGILGFQQAVVTFILQGILLLLSIVSYFLARNIEKTEGS
ncbi:MAG: hypothetical protein JXA25_03990 [Anaerolineales bacterium]|nr:hypothetical protein [Anaerolineales bacterium]